MIVIQIGARRRRRWKINRNFANAVCDDGFEEKYEKRIDALSAAGVVIQRFLGSEMHLRKLTMKRKCFPFRFDPFSRISTASITVTSLANMRLRQIHHCGDTLNEPVTHLHQLLLPHVCDECVAAAAMENMQNVCVSVRRECECARPTMRKSRKRWNCQCIGTKGKRRKNVHNPVCVGCGHEVCAVCVLHWRRDHVRVRWNRIKNTNCSKSTQNSSRRHSRSYAWNVCWFVGECAVPCVHVSRLLLHTKHKESYFAWIKCFFVICIEWNGVRECEREGETNVFMLMTFVLQVSAYACVHDRRTNTNSSCAVCVMPSPFTLFFFVLRPYLYLWVRFSQFCYDLPFSYVSVALSHIHTAQPSIGCGQCEIKLQQPLNFARSHILWRIKKYEKYRKQMLKTIMQLMCDYAKKPQLICWPRWPPFNTFSLKNKNKNAEVCWWWTHFIYTLTLYCIDLGRSETSEWTTNNELNMCSTLCTRHSFDMRTRALIHSFIGSGERERETRTDHTFSHTFNGTKKQFDTFHSFIRTVERRNAFISHDSISENCKKTINGAIAWFAFIWHPIANCIALHWRVVVHVECVCLATCARACAIRWLFHLRDLLDGTYLSLNAARNKIEFNVNISVVNDKISNVFPWFASQSMTLPTDGGAGSRIQALLLLPQHRSAVTKYTDAMRASLENSKNRNFHFQIRHRFSSMNASWPFS